MIDHDTIYHEPEKNTHRTYLTHQGGPFITHCELTTHHHDEYIGNALEYKNRQYDDRIATACESNEPHKESKHDENPRILAGEIEKSSTEEGEKRHTAKYQKGLRESICENPFPSNPFEKN